MDWKPEFPKFTTLGSGENAVRLKIDKLQRGEVDEAKAIFTSSIRSGTEVGLDEFTDAQIDDLFNKCLENNYRGGWGAVVFTDEQGEVVAVWLMYPSPLVRSSQPVYAGVYFAVNKKHKYRGLSTNLEYLQLSYFSPLSQGYIGFGGKASIIVKSIASGIQGMVYKGIIPDSLNIAKYGRVPDIIVFTKDFRMTKAADVKKKELKMRDSKLPQLKADMYHSSLNKAVTLSCDKIDVYSMDKMSNEHVSIKSATTAEDVLTVEQIIRGSAERGDGFGMDEFDGNGFFNRRLLRHSHVILAQTLDGSTVGAAVFGPSTLTRSTSTTTLAVYVATSRAMANSDLQSKILEIIMQWAMSEMYESVLLDIYYTDHRMMSAAHQMGFDIVGSVPHSGYIRGLGLTGCALHHRYLEENFARVLEQPTQKHPSKL